MAELRAPRHELSAHCWHCGISYLFAEGTTDLAPPSDGDISLCYHCGASGVFVAGAFGLALRQPTAEEDRTIARHPQVRRVRAAVAESYDPRTAAGLAYSGPPWFVCPRCGAASSHPDDLWEGYCGACHDWTGQPGGEAA